MVKVLVKKRLISTAKTLSNLKKKILPAKVMSPYWNVKKNDQNFFHFFPSQLHYRIFSRWSILISGINFTEDD